MEVKVCRSCRKMFQYIAGPEICPNCKQAEEEMFQEVKEYLRKHPGANMYEVNQETGVSATLIEKFLRQGRLQVASDSPMALTCERCGKRISTGRYCHECKNEISSGIDEAKKKLVNPDKSSSDAGPKMRYLQSDKIK